MVRERRGVDVNLGDACSARAFEWAVRTVPFRGGRPGAVVPQADGGFANVLAFGDLRVAISSDGVGTKAELAERTGFYDSLGLDLVAMVIDDLVAVGSEPVAVSNILDVNRPDAEIVDRLMRGLHDAARTARVVVTGGEIAELGGRVSGWGERMHFNWSGTGLGILPAATEPMDGRNVEPGQAVLALRSRGFRCNGFTLVREIMGEAFGEAWHVERRADGVGWGEALLTPSLVFAPALRRLAKVGLHPAGIAHITGGGIPGNLARILRANELGADLDGLFAPRCVMREIQEIGGVADELAYRRWNMGNGMLVVIDAAKAGQGLLAIEAAGYEAKRAGTITREPVISLRPCRKGASCLAFPAKRVEGRAG